jgi:outer membrane protein assembly factor BamB
MMTSQRHIFILDANNNGAKLASYTTPSGSWSSPTIANERLYIGNHDWNVYCFANTITATTNSPTGNNLNSPSSTIMIALITAIAVLAVVTIFYFSRKLKKVKKPNGAI